jgi:hypothetical protein
LFVVFALFALLVAFIAVAVAMRRFVFVAMIVAVVGGLVELRLLDMSRKEAVLPLVVV